MKGKGTDRTTRPKGDRFPQDFHRKKCTATDGTRFLVAACQNKKGVSNFSLRKRGETAVDRDVGLREKCSGRKKAPERKSDENGCRVNVAQKEKAALEKRGGPQRSSRMSYTSLVFQRLYAKDAVQCP